MALNIQLEREWIVKVKGFPGKWRVKPQHQSTENGREFVLINPKERSLIYLLAQAAQRAADIKGVKNLSFSASDTLEELKSMRNEAQRTAMTRELVGASLFAVAADAAVDADSPVEPASKRARIPRGCKAWLSQVDTKIITVTTPTADVITLLGASRTDAPLRVEMTPQNMNALFIYLVQSGIAFTAKQREEAADEGEDAEEEEPLVEPDRDVAVDEHADMLDEPSSPSDAS
jgi:hypothetical protein